MVNVKKWTALPILHVMKRSPQDRSRQAASAVLFCHFNDRFLILLELNQQYPSGLAWCNGSALQMAICTYKKSLCTIVCPADRIRAAIRLNHSGYISGIKIICNIKMIYMALQHTNYCRWTHDKNNVLLGFCLFNHLRCALFSIKICFVIFYISVNMYITKPWKNTFRQKMHQDEKSGSSWQHTLNLLIEGVLENHQKTWITMIMLTLSWLHERWLRVETLSSASDSAYSEYFCVKSQKWRHLRRCGWMQLKGEQAFQASPVSVRKSSKMSSP